MITPNSAETPAKAIKPTPVATDRLRPQAYWRRCQRKTRLHTGRIYRRTSYPWQLDLRTVRNTDSGASTGACDRHSYPNRWAAGPGDDRQVRRSFTAVSPGKNLQPCRLGHTALDAGAMGRCLRRTVATAGRRLARRRAPTQRNTCRRNVGADAFNRRQENPSSVCLGLCHDTICLAERCRLRLRPAARVNMPALSCTVGRACWCATASLVTAPALT